VSAMKRGRAGGRARSGRAPRPWRSGRGSTERDNDDAHHLPRPPLAPRARAARPGRGWRAASGLRGLTFASRPSLASQRKTERQQSRCKRQGTGMNVEASEKV
jgi:hypothetical protein